MSFNSYWHNCIEKIYDEFKIIERVKPEYSFIAQSTYPFSNDRPSQCNIVMTNQGQGAAIAYFWIELVLESYVIWLSK